ncbi:MAG: hypothetical protein PHW73_01875 [Atribacterota bacterium]|nr:hypothetical protein [Atribacterota bacterium]
MAWGKFQERKKEETNFGKRRTEIYCHGCERYFTVELDFDLNGNHEIKCPNCNHVHYRVIEKGRVTGERYRSSMGSAWTYSVVSYSQTYTASSDYSGYSTTTSAGGYGGGTGGYVSTWATGDSNW